MVPNNAQSSSSSHAAEGAASAQAMTAAKLVPEVIRRSSHMSDDVPPVVRLGFICARAFYLTEREDLARLVDLETLVALREDELVRSERALERETRRSEQDMQRLQVQRAALEGYHTILSYPSHGHRNGDGEEDSDYDDDDEEYSDEDDYDDDEDEEEDDHYDRVGLARAVNQVLSDEAALQQPPQASTPKYQLHSVFAEEQSSKSNTSSNSSDESDEGSSNH